MDIANRPDDEQSGAAEDNTNRRRPMSQPGIPLRRRGVFNTTSDSESKASDDCPSYSAETGAAMGMTGAAAGGALVVRRRRGTSKARTTRNRSGNRTSRRGRNLGGGAMRWVELS